MNCVDELTEDMLGFAETLTEVTIGEEKYTFVEGVQNPYSCTIMVQGQNPHTIAQIKDSIRDGLRAVKNAVEDKALIAGAGAFEIAAREHLIKAMADVKGRAKLGVQAYADALLVIPKALASNSGFDLQDTLIKLQDAHKEHPDKPVGLDVVTGEPMYPAQQGVWDNFRVKRSVFHLSTVLASQLLLVDEMMRAGRGSRPKDPNAIDLSD